VSPPNVQHVVLFHHLRRLLGRLAAAGIDAAPLKGAHLVTAVYPPEEDRGPMADVDLLLRPAHWDNALRLMLEQGFRPRTGALREAQLHEVGFLLDAGAAQPFLFEAHRFLLDPRRFPLDHEGIWLRSTTADFDGAPCRRLAGEDHLCFGAVHEVMHRLANLPRTLRDLELLLDPGGADPLLVGRIARQWRVTRMVWLFLDLLDRRRPALNLSPVCGLLAPPAPVRRILRRLISEDGARLGDLGYRQRAAVLWPLLFDSPPPLVRYLARHPLGLGRPGRGERPG
jgi:hypothetical protein